MTPGQTSMALYSCRTCGVELEYQGVGRPPAYCAEHRPTSFPPLRGVRSSQQLNGPVSAGIPRARRSDPQTSRDAAASITPGRTENRILEVLADLELTADEIGARLPDIYGPTLRSALARLHTSGFVVETGETRNSLRGRPSSVWRKP